MNKKKGFTVVELVIVIAVIGVLSAILIPTFAGLIKKSQEQTFQLELRNTYVEYTADENIPAEEIKAEGDVYVVVVSGETKTAYELDANGKWVEKADAVLTEDASKIHGPYTTKHYIYEK